MLVCHLAKHKPFKTYNFSTYDSLPRLNSITKQSTNMMAHKQGILGNNMGHSIAYTHQFLHMQFYKTSTMLRKTIGHL